MTLISDLKATKRELINRGWSRGHLQDTQGNVCILGAIGMATQEDFSERCKISETEAFIDLTKSPRAKDIVATLGWYLDKTFIEEEAGHDDFFERTYWFNDHKVEKQDVLDLFDKALADLGDLG